MPIYIIYTMTPVLECMSCYNLQHTLYGKTHTSTIHKRQALKHIKFFSNQLKAAVRGKLTRYMRYSYHFTLITCLTFHCLNESNELVKLLLCERGNTFLHHHKLLIFFHCLILLQSVHIHSIKTGSRDFLHYSYVLVFVRKQSGCLHH